MIIVQKTATIDNDWEYRNGIVITMDDKTIIRLYDWETEDNTLSRNFSDCYNIYSIIKDVYELGRKWVEIDFDSKDVSWGEIYY